MKETMEVALVDAAETMMMNEEVEAEAEDGERAVLVEVVVEAATEEAEEVVWEEVEVKENMMTEPRVRLVSANALLAGNEGILGYFTLTNESAVIKILLVKKGPFLLRGTIARFYLG